MKNEKYITIDGARLMDSISKSRFSNAQICTIIGRSHSYLNNIRKANRIAENDMAKICALLDTTVKDYVVAVQEAKKEEKKQLPMPAGNVEQRMVAIESRLADIADALERIASYTSQSNAKLYRLCEELLK